MDIDSRSSDDHGKTVLHLAVSSDNMTILVLLLRKGVNINAKVDHGRTVPHLAVKYRIVKIVQDLLENGAKMHGQSG